VRLRPSSIFRGSELPRLLLLVAIVLAGWPLIVIFSRPQAAEAPPPPSVPVERITKIVPDQSIEFQALRDKRPIESRDSAAYAILLQRTRETPAEELTKQARRDVFWTQLWERPDAYRGVPIHLEGTAKKVLTHEVGPAMSSKGRLYEVWFFSDENRAFPYVVMIEDAPPGLVVGHELYLRVTVDGYFMKQLGYRATDVARWAPMLVGRVHFIPKLAAAPGPMVEIRDFTQRHGLAFLIAILLGYVALRVVFQIRKALTVSSRPTTYRATSEGLPPEDVAEWLRNLPDEMPEPEEEIPPLREGSHLDDR
jgi:hypothetical protein